VTLYTAGARLGRYGDDGRWAEVAATHGLGAVPIVMHLNERLSGEFEGESELVDIIGLTDAVARSLTNLQFAQEAHGIPAVHDGVTKGDFVDADGKPVPMFEAYFDAITSDQGRCEGRAAHRRGPEELRDRAEHLRQAGGDLLRLPGPLLRHHDVESRRPRARSGPMRTTS
jgi:hypothetical protein